MQKGAQETGYCAGNQRDNHQSKEEENKLQEDINNGIYNSKVDNTKRNQQNSDKTAFTVVIDTGEEFSVSVNRVNIL